jgi:hypothetical protein
MTLMVGVGAYVLSLPLSAALGAGLTLAVSLLWVVLAAPIFAAGGRTPLDGLLRGGAVADASLVVLLVLAAGSPALSLVGALNIYLLWSAVALTECAAVVLARRSWSRRMLSLAAGMAAVLVAGGPFVGNGLLLGLRGGWRQWSAWAVVALNPLLAAFSCLPGGFACVWQERPILYEHTVLGRDVPMPTVGWYVTAVAYALLAAVFGAVAAGRRRRLSRPGQRGAPTAVAPAG